MSKGGITISSIILTILTLLMSFFIFSSKRWIDNVEQKIQKIDRIEWMVEQIWAKQSDSRPSL